MERLETPPESRSLEISDLSSETGSHYPWRVGMIYTENDTEEYKDVDEKKEFMDCIQVAPDDVSIFPRGYGDVGQ